MTEVGTNEEIKKHIDQMKDIYDSTLMFIDNHDAYAERDLDYFLKCIDKYDIQHNKQIFDHFIGIIISIANNHHRQPGFFHKIEQILINYQTTIKENNSNFGIYEKFESNKRLLYFLIKSKILTIDKNIEKLIKYKIEKNGINYSNFFLIEIQKNNNNDDLLTYYSNNIEEYDEKRQKGENDSYVCSLIRDDSIEDFVSFVNRSHLSLSSQIPPSIFETNSFLIDKRPTLIEYAAFYGSIQIFQYLYFNKVKLNGSIWIYAIHSNNSNFIRNYIEKEHIEPDDETYKEILNECVKCHHNEIARYIQDNLINEKSTTNDKELIDIAFKYYNYSFFPIEFNQNFFVFCCLCKYNYASIVDILIKSKRNEIENKTVFKFNFFFIKFQ